jgi:hypothetical protein
VGSWTPEEQDFKGSVQQKLRWVENGFNKSVGASDCGAGHSFVVYLDFILVLPYFGFRLVLPKLKASSGSIGEAVRAT